MSGAVRLNAIGIVVACFATATAAASGPVLAAADPKRPSLTDDCFMEAAAAPAAELRLTGPAAVEWNKRTDQEIKLAVDVVNGGKKTWLINKRGFSDGSPLPGHEEFVLRIVKPDGQYLRTAIHELEGVYPNRKDFAEVRGGSSLTIPLHFGERMYSLPAGSYTLELCFWDRSQVTPQGHGRMPVFRGPMRLSPIRFSVID